MFYHIKNLQSTKTPNLVTATGAVFYHIKNLQSTKTVIGHNSRDDMFYHIKNLQSTKTRHNLSPSKIGFITLRIYKVLKPQQRLYALIHS